MPAKTLAALLLVLLCAGASAQQKGYYRTPAIYKNTVVFTAEGDLWKYDLGSGLASRLTTHEGLETLPLISPDGKTLYFTGEYEGVPELYCMPMEGGVPKRLTYDFDGSMKATCFTNDGKVVYRTSTYDKLPSTQLVRLDASTLSRQPIPLATGSDGCYDKSGVLYFTRWPFQGSQTKRYKGGNIEQIWKFDGRNEATCLTCDFDGTSTRPMLYGGRIYFLSDRDGTMNLWSMDTGGKGLKQHTFSKGWDLRSASMYAGSVVYQKGADIWLFDAAAETEKMLDIRLVSDFDQRKPCWIKSPAASVTFSALSPNGNYVALISRGRVFVSPAKSDRWVEINRRSGIRYKAVQFVNDHTLALLSDESGEYEIWTVTADGSEGEKQLTKGTKTMIRHFVVSPDGKYIAYDDQNDVLRIVEVAGGAVRYEYSEAYDGVGGMGWSPDSRFLHFNRGLENRNSQICIVDTRGMKMTPVTTTRLNSGDPAWSADSNWLYFVSDRNLHTRVQSPWGPRQPEPFYTETDNFYAMPLEPSLRFPFLSTDTWLTDSAFNPAAAKKKTTPAARTYDWDQLQALLYQLPVKSGNLGSLQAAADGWLYWLDYGPAGNRDGAKLMALKAKESKKYEPVEIAAGVNWFGLSGNRKKLMVGYRNRTLTVDDADGKKVDVDKDKLTLDNWSFQVDPAEDWKEMFADAWRMMRDYFYDRDLHKVDWVATRQRYEPLVSRLTDRYELDDLLSQMVGELSALHTFVFGGDKRVSPDQIPVGFLGAVLGRDARGAVIDHIYRGDPDYPDVCSPLRRPELHIHEGDIITAVNNVPLNQVADISVLLANKVGVPVKLDLVDKTGKAYAEVVKPFSSGEDYNLRYGEWELERRERTDSMSHDDIGYVHLRAMGGSDMDAFVKQFYPVFNRKGLIIDVRHNFGGNIDSWVLEKLVRKAWMYWQGRSGGPFWNMPYAFRGHMVILCDQVTASDGEAITEGFRRLGLGKVIGMRTWGGEIWLSMDNRLVDNGIASAAELGVFGPEEKWLIEGHGVDPDIAVDNLPFATYRGRDAQLEAAVEYLKKQIAAEPVPPVRVPAHPDKGFKYGF
ncbi:MAG TPA: S41 family peptidase [Puia sp.]|uniref:S41 family peptidase n=1 Tax=Puia sp. TaxID=2045100 RepID=UPI002C5E5899|nr:S41 family peptidase [Puia sp.]HVU95365.1 S41 family peptidase [Puia sp.]